MINTAAPPLKLFGLIIIGPYMVYDVCSEKIALNLKT